MVEITNGEKVYSLKGCRGALCECKCPPPQLVCRQSQALCFVSTQKYTNPTEGAFLAGLGPPTHGSLFKPPPILYSSVRGGLLTQPNSTQQNLDLDPTEEGGHAHMHKKTATQSLQTYKHIHTCINLTHAGFLRANTPLIGRYILSEI